MNKIRIMVADDNRQFRAGIRAMLRRGRGYRDHEYLLLKVQKATATRRLRRTA